MIFDMLKKSLILFSVLTALISTCPTSSLAQAPDDEFGRAVWLYSEGNYKEAREGFRQLAFGYPGDERFSIFKFMLSKCDYYLGSYDKAQAGFKSFIYEFPQSFYLGHTHFMLGNISYLKGDRLGAAKEYLKAFEYAKDKELQGLAYNSLIPLLEVGLSLKEHKELSRWSRGRKLADEVLFILAQKEIKQENFAQAKDILEQYIENYPGGEHFREAKRLLKDVSKSARSIYKIGVLAPLSGVYQVYGQNLLRGIRLSLGNNKPGKVELIVKDTQGNPIKTAHKTKELIEEDGAVAVVGPLKSDCAASAVAVADCFSVPLISPTASEEGIATLGSHIFQLSTSTKKMGGAMAGYAVEDMGLWEFAVLAPDDIYGRNAAMGFEEEVERWGGRIVAKQFYPRESTDFGKQLKAIREVLFKEKEEREEGIDTTKYVDIEGRPLPFDAIPVEVDGFFIPGYSEEIISIAPQVAFTKIETNLLGTEGWKNKRIMELAKDYVQKAVFVSDSYEPEESPDGFVASYQKVYGEKPDRIAALGYDALGFLGLALEAGVSTSEEIGDYLSKIQNFEGASGNFNFNPEGENQSFSVFIIEGKEFKKIK